MDKKKVLIFLPSSTGGAERVAVTIGKMLPRDRYSVKFIVVNRTLGTIVNFIPKEYPVIHLPAHNIWCAVTLRMAKIIRAERADIVFSSMQYLTPRVAIAARLVSRGIKTIARMPNTPTSFRWDSILLLKFCYRYISLVVTQQEEMKSEFEHLFGDTSGKIIVLHNPIDTKAIESKLSAPNPYEDNGSQTKYVWVGRFNRQKGQDLLVKAFEKVHNSNPCAHLYLVGGYDKNDSFFIDIQNFVQQKQLGDCVHFVGFDSNPYRWVRYCDCFVMPSRLEGLPNALIEAMYIGRPVVATKCIPVVSRIVSDGVNGFLAESGDIESIADCMLKAPALKNVHMTYRPSSDQDFINIFQ